MSRVLHAGFIGLMALLSAALVEPANARIACQGEFQVTQFGLVATPYCGEEEIARVANNYGWRVSPAEVHNNPLTKVYICQTLAMIGEFNHLAWDTQSRVAAVASLSHHVMPPRSLQAMALGL